jgi:hypothetical protein
VHWLQLLCNSPLEAILLDKRAAVAVSVLSGLKGVGVLVVKVGQAALHERPDDGSANKGGASCTGCCVPGAVLRGDADDALHALGLRLRKQQGYRQRQT